MTVELKTSTELADRISELETRLRDFGTGPLKAELARLQRQQVDTITQELHDAQLLGQKLADETLELERAYELAIASLTAYVESAEAVRALKPQWSRTWYKADRAGLDVPPRVPDFSARSSRDAAIRQLSNRALTLRTAWQSEMEEVLTHELEGADGMKGFYTFVPRKSRDGSHLTGVEGEGFKKLLENSVHSLSFEADKSRLSESRSITKTATGLFKLRLPPK